MLLNMNCESDLDKHVCPSPCPRNCLSPRPCPASRFITFHFLDYTDIDSCPCLVNSKLSSQFANIELSFGWMTYESELVGKLIHRLANKLDQDHVVSNLKQVDQKSIKSHKSRGYCNNKTHHIAWMTKYILYRGYTIGFDFKR